MAGAPTPGGRRLYLAKGSRTPPLTGHPLATLPPYGRPHRGLWPPPPSLAPYRPPTGQKGMPQLATGRGAFAPAPHWPPTGPKTDLAK